MRFITHAAQPANMLLTLRHARILCTETWPMITSPANGKLKLMKALHKRRQREKQGLLLVEGHRLVLDALDAGITPQYVVVHDGALAQNDLEAALRKLGPERVLRAPESLVNEISDTETPQGVLAVLPHAPRPLPEKPSLVLVCDEVRDPGNLGTLLRSAAGAGVGACLLTPGCCDPWGLKALRAGMGAQWRLPTHQLDGWDDVSMCLRGWNCRTFAADAGGTLNHYDVDWRGASALVVGSEAHGLSDAVRNDPSVSLCGIPMGGDGSDGVESLNAAVAGSVILFEAQRQRLVAAGVVNAVGRAQ